MMPICVCVVTLKQGSSELQAEVSAESAFEAAILAIHKFERNRSFRGVSRGAVLTVKATHTQVHSVKAGDALDWLSKPARNDAQRERKKYLKAVLADDRH